MTRPTLRMALALCTAFPATAADTDTLPEPYKPPELSTQHAYQYSLRPAAGMLLPYLVDQDRNCTTDTPISQVWVHPDGETVEVSALQGDGYNVVFADIHTPIGSVLAAVPDGIPIRSAALYTAQTPRSGEWCGSVVPWTAGRVRGRRFDAGDVTGDAIGGAAIRHSEKKGSVIVAFPPTTPWGDAVFWLEQLNQELDGLQLVLHDKAQPPPSVVFPVQEQPAPSETDIQVVGDTGPLGVFETPTRFVHPSGQVLAIYENGTIFIPRVSQDGSRDWLAIDATIAANPDWEPRTSDIATVSAIGNEVDLGQRGHARLRGTPDDTQRAMIRLGLATPGAGVVRLGRMASASWDGSLRLPIDRDGQWSDEYIRADQVLAALTDLSSLHDRGDGPVLECRSEVEGPVWVSLSSDQVSFTNTPSRVEVRHLGLTTTGLAHPQVRAACVGAAITLAHVSQVGGVNGGEEESHGPLGIPWIHQSDVRIKTEVRPRYPQEAIELDLEQQDCRVVVSIDTSGTPTDVTFHQCLEPFRETTRDAVMAMRFYPHRVDGEETPAQFGMKFLFVP